MADEASIINSLDLGTARETLTGAPGSPLSELLIALTEDVIERLQAALVERDINTSTLGLSQSIAPTEVTLVGSAVSVGISMEFYWKYINSGVNGTEVNHGAPAWGPAPAQELSFKDTIKAWIPARGLQLPSRFKTFDQFAWAIMTNVIKRGQRPRPFFDDVVNPSLVEIMKAPIEQLMGKSITVAIVSPWQ